MTCTAKPGSRTEVSKPSAKSVKLIIWEKSTWKAVSVQQQCAVIPLACEQTYVSQKLGETQSGQASWFEYFFFLVKKLYFFKKSPLVTAALTYHTEESINETEWEKKKMKLSRLNELQASWWKANWEV